MDNPNRLSDLAEALSATGGTCAYSSEPHAHGRFCVNWRPLSVFDQHDRSQSTEHHQNG